MAIIIHYLHVAILNHQSLFPSTDFVYRFLFACSTNVSVFSDGKSQDTLLRFEYCFRQVISPNIKFFNIGMTALI